MARGMMGRILEGIRRRREDSELQMYATEPPGAMGEGSGDWFVVSGGLSGGDYVEAHNYGQDRAAAEASVNAPQDVLDVVKPRVIQAASEQEAIQKYKQPIQVPKAECDDEKFTPAKPGNLDEDEWMSLNEMELTCVECADKMRERKMTAILRREAKECIAKYGKKDGVEE